MRVIAGHLGGRRLKAPPAAAHARGGDALRPTSDRVREALFARLGPLDGARVLDLFAGTGALGIEALSRGAAHAVFVERATVALGVLRENLSALGLEAVSRVVRAEAADAVERLGRAGERFDLVLLDPPYAADQAGPVLEALVRSGALAPHAVVVAESGRRHPVPPVAGLRRTDERRYGDTVLTTLVPEGRPEADGGSLDA